MDLSNIDPNLIAGLTTLVTALGGWLWHKGKGEKTRDIGELLDEAITHEVLDALEDGETLDTIEDRLTAAALKLASKAGVTIPKYTARVAVQWGVVEFRKLVRKRKENQDAVKRIPGQLAENAAAADAIAETFKKFPPNVAIDTISEAKAAGVELLEIGPDGKLGPAK